MCHEKGSFSTLEFRRQLHKIAIQLQDALDICIHDNELLLIEHMPNHSDRQNYNGAHDRLLRAYDPDEAKERFQRHLRLRQLPQYSPGYVEQGFSDLGFGP